MADPNRAGADATRTTGRNLYIYLTVPLLAAAVYFGCIGSPPSLMDDVDAVQAQIARTMLTSGDWVTARLDGIAYLEKSPLIYWAIAGTYEIFGVHDWAARIPMALSCVALCWLTAAFGIWAFGPKAGFYAGAVVATCVGLFLFTRVLIPDVMLTFTIALAMWAFLRALDEEERHPRMWAFILAASLGVGLLLKSTVAVLFPVAGGVIYLFLTRQLFSRATWKKLHPWSGALVILVIAAPWHVLATLRNPPYFSFSMQSRPGEYHGFLWFYFMNEQVLRFLNLRYPRDYNTVPRVWFWLLHLVWLFPWSVYFPAVAKTLFGQPAQKLLRPLDRAGRTRLLALCWSGFLVVFFTFSTTQEYYTMPCYPALALLLGSAMAAGGKWVRRGTRAIAIVAGCVGVVLAAILVAVWNLPAPGDIANALVQRPGTYTLSMSHMGDLTLASFAYLRVPLGMAVAALIVGAAGNLRATGRNAFLATALMMVLFFQAARQAMVIFDPYLSSRPLAEALLRAPAGKLMVDHHYYTFSSIFFYTNRSGLLLNGRINNMVYGSYAPGAPDVFIDDAQWKQLWQSGDRYYLTANDYAEPRLEKLVGKEALYLVKASGGKVLLTNQPLR